MARTLCHESDSEAGSLATVAAAAAAQPTRSGVTRRRLSTMIISGHGGGGIKPELAPEAGPGWRWRRILLRALRRGSGGSCGVRGGAACATAAASAATAGAQYGWSYNPAFSTKVIPLFFSSANQVAIMSLFNSIRYLLCQ